MSRLSRTHLVLVTMMFIASGFSGLVYQSVWSQYLGLLLGHAAYAQALVLAIFMGGMALGSMWASRRIGGTTRPMRRYGQVEALIGLAGLVFHSVFLLVSNWLFERALPSVGSPWLAGLLCWLAAAALILPQTVLLGMTFPLMSSALIRMQPGQSGRILGGLYFLNSIGAAVGALMASFLIVPRTGLPGAMWFAGVINLVIFAATLLVREDTTAPREFPDRAASARTSSHMTRIVLLAATLTGLSSFMYEIGWIRMLAMVLGSSLHAFELMLAAFIGGLAFGGLAVRRWLTNAGNTLRLVGNIQVAMGCAALLTLLCYGNSFGWVSWLMEAIAKSDRGYTLFNLASAAIAMVIMLPAAFFAGMTLPALTFILLRSSGSERAIGQVYAFNTLGSILGVFLMIHLAVPLLGLKLGMILAGSIDIVLGLYLLGRAEGSRTGLKWASLLSGIMLVGAFLFADFDPRKLASGVYRTGVAELDEHAKVFYSADGKTASVAVVAHRDGTASIRTNGKPDASLQMVAGQRPTQDEHTMILAGLLGFAYNPAASDIGIIGFGSGLTTHSVAAAEQVRKIDTIEIEREMVRAAGYFGARVERAYTDPRSNIILDDARAYFSSGQRRYDIIISEPSNPWIAGVAKLFSREFYGFVPRHLTKRGILVQWLHIYEIDTRTVLSMLAALDATFSDYHLYFANQADLILVATPSGQLPEPTGDFLKSPGLSESARYIGVRSLNDLRLRLALRASDVRALLAAMPVPVNTDFHPYVTFQAPVDRFREKRASDLFLLPTGPGSVLALLDPIVGTDLAAAPWSAAGVLHPLVDRRLDGQATALALLDELPRPYEVPELIYELRELGAGCFSGLSEQKVLDLLLNAFEVTAFAEHRHFARVWVNPPWIQCGNVAPSPRVQQALAAFAALAADRREDLAASLLALAEQSPPESAPGWLGLALYSVRDQPSEVIRIWTQWKAVSPLTPEHWLYFETLVQRFTAPGSVLTH